MYCASQTRKNDAESFRFTVRKDRRIKERPGWERVGVLMDKEDGKKSDKGDLLSVGQWVGWLVVAERKDKETEAF